MKILLENLRYQQIKSFGPEMSDSFPEEYSCQESE